jgi:phage baseplate assembly protein W
MIIKRTEYTVNTTDLVKNRGLGLALPFNPVNIFTINYTTVAQVKSNLLNFLLTNRGERPFNPDFGADLRKLLFDQMADLSLAQDLLKSRIALYFPEVIVKALDFTPDPSKNSLTITLNFSVRNQPDTLVIQIV